MAKNIGKFLTVEISRMNVLYTLGYRGYALLKGKGDGTVHIVKVSQPLFNLRNFLIQQ